MFDEKYKEILKNELKLDNFAQLHNIVGEEEFKSYLKNLCNESYLPGNRNDITKVDTFDNKNIENGKFCANLHIHTKYSDGLASVNEILDNAAAIADKLDKPFLLAITDHDTIDGVKETLKILSVEKERYKNLKVALGVEISTTGTNFNNQKKTLDIHTLVYCINPFDKELNSFLDRKREMKFNLANNVLNTLNSELEDTLYKLRLKLTLEEASKIHPMILKGEDEVSHPLKKYIFGKMLFSYYVENNEELLNKLNDLGIDVTKLSYEKPVYLYKSMFNNEKYFYIYREALEKYLNNLVKKENYLNLKEIPEWLENALLKGKFICEKAHPMIEKECEGFDAFTPFEKCLELVSSLDYGLMSIAHPGRLPVKYIDSDISDFYAEFFTVFKKYGKDKAYAYEKYYQSYTGKKCFDYLNLINEAAEKFELIPTGGIDSHGKNVYTRCPYS